MPHMCAIPCGPACMPTMWVCLSGDLCVDFDDTDACAVHAPPVSQDLSGGGRARGASVARLRRVARDLDDQRNSSEAGCRRHADRRWKPNAARIVKAGGNPWSFVI